MGKWLLNGILWDYSLVTNSLLLKMAIEIVDLSIEHGDFSYLCTVKNVCQSIHLFHSFEIMDLVANSLGCLQF